MFDDDLSSLLFTEGDQDILNNAATNAYTQNVHVAQQQRLPQPTASSSHVFPTETNDFDFYPQTVPRQTMETPPLNTNGSAFHNIPNFGAGFQPVQYDVQGMPTPNNIPDFDLNLPTGSVISDQSTLKKPKLQKTGDTKSKRRAAVAAASRATRAKRKRELEDLKTKNKRLEKQRLDYLSTIAELQVKVQALRETGSIDLRMENDLLKAELVEHKKFLTNFRDVAQGLPTTDTAKRVMLIQSADTAVAQALALLSTSTVDPSWKCGCISSPIRSRYALRFQRIPIGSKFSEAKRVSLRFDFSELSLSVEKVGQKVWERWTKTGNFNSYSNLYKTTTSISCDASGIPLGNEFNIKKGFRSEEEEKKEKEMIKYENPLKQLEPGMAKERGRISVFKYTERLPNPVASSALALPGSQDVQKLMVVTGRYSCVAGSSFLSPASLLINNRETRNRSIESEFTESPRAECLVLARTFTNPNLEEETVAKVDSKSLEEKNNAIVEAVVLKQTPNGCAMTLTFSLPIETEQSKTIETNKVDPIVDNDGILTKTWEKKLFDEFGDLFNQHSICISAPNDYIPDASTGDFENLLPNLDLQL